MAKQQYQSWWLKQICAFEKRPSKLFGLPAEPQTSDAASATIRIDHGQQGCQSELQLEVLALRYRGLELKEH